MTEDITDSKLAQLESHRLLNERANLINKLEKLAHQDSLTGIFNRRAFLKLAEFEIKRAARVNRPLSVIVFDIDNFKSINDRFGHRTGDEILVSITLLISSELRKIDLFCRYGGDEFVILLPKTSLKEAKYLVNRLKKILKTKLTLNLEKEFYPTISFGVAERTKSEQNIDHLIDRADQVMYQIKKTSSFFQVQAKLIS